MKILLLCLSTLLLFRTADQCDAYQNQMLSVNSSLNEAYAYTQDMDKYAKRARVYSDPVQVKIYLDKTKDAVDDAMYALEYAEETSKTAKKASCDCKCKAGEDYSQYARTSITNAQIHLEKALIHLERLTISGKNIDVYLEKARSAVTKAETDLEEALGYINEGKDACN